MSGLIRKSSLIVLLAGFICSSNLIAQTLTATGDQGKETKIVFTSLDGKPVDIYKINGYSYGSSYSSTITSSGQYAGSSSGMSSSTSMSFVCTAPAELILDKGSVQLMVGGGMTPKTFTITANGGTQEWGVKSGNYGLEFGGIMCLSIGFASGLSGFIMAAIDPELSTPGITVGVIGVVVGLLGIPMMIAGQPKVTLIRVDFN